MLKEFLLSFVGAYIIGLAWNIFRKNDVEILPSLIWLLMMVMPFVVQFDTFPENRRLIQAFGVMFIGICLFVGDSINVGQIAQKGRVSPLQGRWLDNYWLYAALFLIIAGYHLSLLSHIPLVEKYIYGVVDSGELSQMREETSKLLAAPALLKYAFNWIINIIAPLAVVLAIRQKHYLWALSFIGLAGLYAAISLAKAPLSILAIVLITTLIYHCSYRRRLYGYLIVILLCTPIVWDAHNFFVSNPLSIFNLKSPPEAVAALNLPEDDPRKQLTIGDQSRLVSSQVSNENLLTAREQRYNYYAYRVFLGPADVSSRWYQFYPAYSAGFAGLQGLTPANKDHAEMHPARRLGKWAYAERFPDKYLETVQAYASVDADAYARFGVVGVIAAGVILVVLRLLLKVFRGESHLSETLYVIGLVLYGLLWPMASLQAALVANGLGVVLGMMSLIWCVSGYKLKRINL